jgi:hypothetical protein
VVFDGEVSAGGYWAAPLGQGWVFRILPISPFQASYTGWDLVDRQPAAGFPDALLIATMPYNSINEREIGTTFGLRAQDAIGWNPRSFRFVVSPGDFREAQQLFRSLPASTGLHSATGASGGSSPGDRQVMARLLEIQKHAAAGEFRIVDARIVPGVADPAPYAQPWAMASSQTRHTVEQAPEGKSSALGALNWMRFTVTLWLPEGWGVPAPIQARHTACPD